MLLLVILIPLLSSILSGLLGRSIGFKGGSLLSPACIVLTFLISSWCVFDTNFNSSVSYFKLGKWFDTEWSSVYFGFQFDSLTSIMLLVISSISALVHIYSTRYLRDDAHLLRFLSYLSLFTFFMILLVTSDNYVQLFIGWEGVGLSSYLLINFWFARIKANRAAMKAMLINRVGDMALVLGMLNILELFGGYEFTTVSGVLSLNPFPQAYLTKLSLLLFIGSVAKSAQLGLHTWLPDAMEGPTPVSALIHAATMVTAGVFLIIRSSPLFELCPLALTCITMSGGLTALYAATVAIFQNDLKKVVAYSTCSQLAYMVMICGLSSYSVSLFHLMNHAFFKALLFLSAGAVIHSLRDEQDMRKMGALIKYIPFTYVMFLVGSLSLIGIPYLTGFYSKDMILELLYENHGYLLADWLGRLTVVLTAIYSSRLLYMSFLANPNSPKVFYIQVHESKLTILFTLSFLSLGSIVVGYFAKGLFFSRIIVPFVPLYVKWSPILLSLVGPVIVLLVYGLNTLLPSLLLGSIRLYRIGYGFLNTGWQWNYVTNHMIIWFLLHLAHRGSYRLIDRGILEVCGPRGLGELLRGGSQMVSDLQSGSLLSYAYLMVNYTALYLLTSLSLT